ncbi:MAG: hypothetical protein WCP21_00630 [Armatimonadota bacterium]
MRVLNTMLCLLIASAVACTTAAVAGTVAATCAAATTVGIPYVGKGAARVFLRSGEGRWRQIAVKQEEGRLVFELDPSKLGSANLALLIDPPGSMIIDDYAGPTVSAITVDGKALSAGASSDLGSLSAGPKTISVTFKDAANSLSPTGCHATVDGVPVSVRPVWITRQGDREATLRVRLPALEYGKHEITLRASDTSPQMNETAVALRFNYLESGNVALAALGAKVAVDSCFGGYESLVPLNDGNTVMPGDHCGNDISWASSEVAADHWAEVAFPKSTAIREVTVYWAAYTDVSHTARHFEVQIPDGAGWTALYKSPAEGEKAAPLTTARFAPVTVSKFRLFVPAGQGSATRPNLLWIGEIKAR